MSTKVTPIPEGYHTLTPSLVVDDADRAIAFYQAAFGAEVLGRMDAPDGKVPHASLKIGDSILFVTDEFPRGTTRAPRTLGGSSVSLHLYFEDVDAAFDRAVAAGAEVKMPLMDAFWGDRFGMLADPFGHAWAMASRTEIVSHEEAVRRAEAVFAAPQGAC